MQAVGLRTFIWNNAWKTGLLLAGFPLLLCVIGYALALLAVAGQGASIEEGLVQAAQLLPSILPLALAASAVWFGIAFFANQKIIDLASGAAQAPDIGCAKRLPVRLEGERVLLGTPL